jgi:hypothetical protein
MKTCKTCNKTKPFSEFYTNGKTPKGTVKYKPSCKECSESERQRFSSEKLDLVKERYGTHCVRCGYSKCYAALEFHHPNPREKEFIPSSLIHNASPVETLFKELDKCVLLCANCHREIHH